MTLSLVLLFAVLLPAASSLLVSAHLAPLVWSIPAIFALLLATAAAHAITGTRRFRERLLIVGTSPLAFRLIRELEARPRNPYAVVGMVAEPGAPAAPEIGCPVLGRIEHLGKILEDVRPHRIIVALADRRGRLPVGPLLEWRVRGVVVEDAGDAYERVTGKLAIESLAPSSLIFSNGFRRSPVAQALGRAASALAAILAFIGLALLFGLIALAIKLDSPGPVLFIQERIGLGGRRFKFIKFRTMRPATCPTSEWVGDNSHRITRVGGWLRRFRLDELPQLVNILRGDMNLIGPRPHPVSNADLFLREIPYYALRSTVRPGLTGWAQVRYRYANGLEEEIEKMRYDLYYIKHLSLGLDFRILFDTIRVVLSGRGSVATGAERAETRIEARREPPLTTTVGHRHAA